MKNTILKLRKSFRSAYATGHNIRFFRSSGRMEIIGNHTDHQGGKVLVGAINLHVYAAASPNDDQIFHLVSDGYPALFVNMLNTATEIPDENKTNTLIRGVAQAFRNAGYKVGGINVAMYSYIPTGSGVSSSAAISLLIGQMLSFFYNGNKVSKLELALFAKYAENVYFHKPSGLLDQLGIALGDINYIDFHDETNPYVETIHNPFDGLGFVIIDTGGNHSDLTVHYSQIRLDMAKISTHYGKEKLSELSPQVFFNDYQKLIGLYGQVPVERALHYFKECRNVELAKEALEKKDLPSFLNFINASGRSSELLLRNITYPEDTQFLLMKGLQFCRKQVNGKGAVRVHGGGFAGTVLVVIEKRYLDDFLAEAVKYFGKKSIHQVQTVENGLLVIENRKI